jgi:uncharacterized membrane protein
MTSGTAGGTGVTGLVRPLVSSVLAGAATGSRSSIGLAALTMTARPEAGSQPDRTLSRPWAKALAGLAAATEITTDKLPGTPSRLAPAGLGSRLAAGAASGVVVARRVPGGPGAGAPATPVLIAVCVAAGAGTAAATCWLGAQWRAWASERFGRDWVGAVIEDGVAISLATAGATLSG